MTQFIKDRDIYEKIILELIPKTRQFLWIATADIKDMYIERRGKSVPFLSLLNELILQKKSIRLIHAKEPGEMFRKDFDKYPLLWDNLERVCCPRVHFKTVIIDSLFTYIGSANLTGAGLGAKGSNKRNFENGILTDDKKLIEPAMQQFDELWIGKHCKTCQRKEYCGDRINL